MAKQNVILGDVKSNIKQDTQNTNYVEISTSQSGKALVTIAASNSLLPLSELIEYVVAGYGKAIESIGHDFSVANEPNLKVEITTSAKGVPQVTVSGDEDYSVTKNLSKDKDELIIRNDHEIARQYNDIVKAVTRHMDAKELSHDVE
jgi:hypothetical protein